MKRNNNYTPVLFVVSAVGAAFLFGYKSKEKEKEAASYAVEKGLGMASDAIKSQADETSKWANQVWNTWKQIWGK
jgi:hypothetical protein